MRSSGAISGSELRTAVAIGDEKVFLARVPRAGEMVDDGGRLEKFGVFSESMAME